MLTQPKNLDAIRGEDLLHMPARIAAALRFLQQSAATLAPGRHTIDGERIFAIVQEYQTKPRSAGVWEAHRRYLDIQHVVHGVERMGMAPADRLKISRPYAEENDCVIFAEPADEATAHFFTVSAGQFIVFSPADAHMPGLADSQPAPVRKVVVKVEVG